MIAIEVGNSATKVKTSKECLIFPSAIAEERGSMNLGLASPGVFEFEGINLLVGERAIAKANLIYSMDLEWLIKYTPLFCVHALKTAKCEDEDTVVVGLPPEYFFDHQERLRNRLYSFMVNGREYGFKRVMVMPQGVGSFADYCSKNPPLESDVSLLVDIGANTINMMLAHGEMIFPEDSAQFSRSGACIPAEAVISFLRGKDTTISQAQAHRILKSGNYGGEDITILSEIVPSFAQQVIDKTFNKYANYTLTRIILSGGGAELIKNHLPATHRLTSKICFIDDPLFSNVRGYYLAGLSRISEHKL